MRPLELALKIKADTIQHRRWLHRHAELSMQEKETTLYIEKALKKLGIPCIRPSETGIIGVIKGNRPGKTVALRADIDALPIREENPVSYKSENDGTMHACGHDFNTASLLAAARILVEMECNFPGTVKLIFQPGSEGSKSGALAIMSQGDLDDCGAFVAMHACSALPVGEVSVASGPCLAASSGLFVTIHGAGGHGATPWETVDPIIAASAVIMNLQPLLARELDRHDMAVASIGILRGGTMKNIIPDKVHMEGTLRFYEPKYEQILRKKITRIIEHTCMAHRATADVSISESIPAVNNDENLCRLGEIIARKIWGEDNLAHLPSSMANEDFAFFGEKAPLLYIHVGILNPDKETDYPVNHPRFDVDEDALVGTSAFYAQFALDYLHAEPE